MSHWARVILENAVKAQEQKPEYIWAGLKRIIDIVESSDLLQFRTSEMEEIADDISICDCPIELSRLLWRAATSNGFQHFCLLLLNQGNGVVASSRMLTSFDEKWIGRYREKRYQFVDPIFLAAQCQSGSFRFTEVDSSAPMVQAFWSDAAEHGIGRHGLCHTISRPDGARLAVSFFSSHSEEKTEELLSLNEHDLSVVSQLATECFCYISKGAAIQDDTLTECELRFLHTLATSNDPSRAFEQEAKFGGNRSIQTSIREKLNVETVFQAVAVASSKQWFDHLPISEHEIVSPFPQLLGQNIESM